MRVLLALLAVLTLAAPARAAEELLLKPHGESFAKRVALDGTALGPALTGVTFFGEWFPDGSRILARTSAGGIEAMGPDGENRTVVTPAGPQFVGAPAVSPDGTRFAIVVNDGQYRLMIGSMATGELDELVLPVPLFTTVNFGTIDWSVNDEIAFVSQEEAQSSAVNVIRSDGTGFRQVLDVPTPPRLARKSSTHDQVEDVEFSPDGRTLAVGRYIGLGYDTEDDVSPRYEWRITTVAVHAGGIATDRITGTKHDTEPNLYSMEGVWPYGLSWSPAGGRLAVVGDPDPTESRLRVQLYDVASGTFTPTTIDTSYRAHWRPRKPDPIVFVHGFAGSTLFCGGAEVWPALPSPGLLQMRLAPDGVTDAGGCAVTNQEGNIVQNAGGDIYGSTVAFLQAAAPGRFSLYAWDWRKGPAQAIAGLDRAVEKARCGATPLTAGGTCPDPQSGKVVLMAHSMGGLVSRMYIDDGTRAAKVSRVLTVGTPYWGAAKAFFPLAAGVENPGFSPLDLVLDDEDFKAFAQNLDGEYHLWPSANYGPWLSVEDHDPLVLDRPALLAYTTTRLGGNAALLGRALDWHAAHDGFEANGTDFRVVVGTGVPTVGKVHWIDGPIPLLDRVEVTFVNGDGTVPATSGAQGTVGANSPLGDDVQMRFACNVKHVPLPGHSQVTPAIRGFLLSGADLGALGACPMSGSSVEVFDIGLTGATARANGLSLEDAKTQGLVDVITVGSQRTIVADADTPVTLTVRGARLGLRARSLGDTGGPVAAYGPLAGDVELRMGADVVVRRGGKVVKPTRSDTSPPRTILLVTPKGRGLRIVPQAKDATGVAATFIGVGKAVPSLAKPLVVKAATAPKVRYFSADVFGYVEPSQQLLAVTGLKRRGRRLLVRVACPKGRACKGSVAARNGKARGSKRFSIKAGTARRIVVVTRGAVAGPRWRVTVRRGKRPVSLFRG